VDPKVVYWTGALLNMVAAVAIAGVGVRRIRRSEIAGHQRLMKLAALLVVLFVLSYGVKLFVLGREHLELWEPRFRSVLRFHELCVLVMVLAGSRALWVATRRGLALPVSVERRDSRARDARQHRLAGWTALCASALGAVTAAYVLYGMYARLP
jgi:uncharacterized membrane protein YozB (DUF420 family)